MGYDYINMDKLISESGMPKYSFFRQIGLSEKTFSSWISGSAIPKESTVRKIAGRLGVSLADLRTKSDVNVPPIECVQDDLSKSVAPTSPKTKSDAMKLIDGAWGM